MIRKPHLETEAGRDIYVRLLDLSRRSNRPLHAVLVRYALERLLQRVFSDGHEGSDKLFIAQSAELDVETITLKGGMSMTFAEELPILEGRSTGDADLHIASFGGDMEVYKAILQNGLEGAPRHGPDDGIRFDIPAIKVTHDREERSGGSVVVPLQIGPYYLQIKTDVTFDGRPMHEKAPVVPYPEVLPDSGLPMAMVRRVPFEFMVADKFCAALEGGINNRRVRDYPDMRLVLGKGLVDDDFLAETMAASARFRGLNLPSSMDDVPAFSDEFAEAKAPRWEHERVNRHYVGEEDFPTIIRWLRARLGPVLEKALEMEELPAWSSGPR